MSQTQRFIITNLKNRKDYGSHLSVCQTENNWNKILKTKHSFIRKKQKVKKNKISDSHALTEKYSKPGRDKRSLDT
jgi:hypothetical protein